MSNKAQLQTNNTKLDELTSLAATMKDKAAALPEAGGGSAVETCTVEIIRDTYAYGWYTQLIDGEKVTTSFLKGGTPLTVENVIANSCIILCLSAGYIPEVNISGDATLIATLGYLMDYETIPLVVMCNGGEITLTCTEYI